MILKGFMKKPALTQDYNHLPFNRLEKIKNRSMCLKINILQANFNLTENIISLQAIPLLYLQRIFYFFSSR